MIGLVRTMSPELRPRGRGRWRAVPGAASAVVLFAGVSLAGASQDWEAVPANLLNGITFGVDGTSPTDVWAVGYHTPNPPLGPTLTLTMHFDGKDWSVVSSPNPDPDYQFVSDVAAVRSDWAIAVGTYSPVGSKAQTLALEWDGSSWSHIQSPEAKNGCAFRSITKTPSGEMFAAGTWQEGNGLLAHRTGGSWDVHLAPPVRVFRNRFYGVSALSEDEIWCVGTKGESYGDFEILIQRYDGNGNWTTFDEPTPGWSDSLEDVVAIASDDVWVAGFWYDPGLSATQPLLMHFDGASWTQESLPPFLDRGAELRAIEAISSTEVYASGTYPDNNGIPRPFVLGYDGTGWSEITLPSSGGSYEWFRGMTVTPQNDLWIVGQYFDGQVTAPVTYSLGLHLAMEANADEVPLGGTLELETSTGIANTRGVIYVSALNGVPFFHRVSHGKFDSSGTHLSSYQVPNDPALQDLAVSFVEFGLAMYSGQLEVTNEATVTLR